MENIIRTRVSFDRDVEGTVAYYVVKAPTGELLLYFSLKCGELFEKLDQYKLDLAFRVRDAVNVLQHKDKYTDDECARAEDFLKFEQSAVLGANKPKYDFQCYFLCQSINELKTRRNQFYADFNAESGNTI